MTYSKSYATKIIKYESTNNKRIFQLETRQKSITFNLFKETTHPIIPKSLSFQHHLTICGMGPKSVHRKVRQLRHEKWTKLSRWCPNVTCTGSARLKSLLPEQFQTSTNLVKLSRLPCVECIFIPFLLLLGEFGFRHQH